MIRFKKILLVGCCVFFLIGMTACSNNAKPYYNVTFIVDGEIVRVESVKEGELPSNYNPGDKGMYKFSCWTLEGGTEFKYKKKFRIYKESTLYAQYEFDRGLVATLVQREVLPSVFMVMIDNVGVGSSVIYKHEKNKYYLLSNSHVTCRTGRQADKASKDPSFLNMSVENYSGDKQYKCELLCFDPNYDLAVIEFESEDEYAVVKFADQDPEAGDKCVTVGACTSLGKRNQIYVGTMQGYKKGQGKFMFISQKRSNVTFDVINHSAKVKNGFSGGPLLDESFNLIGINYAKASNKNYYSIPLSKVKEFLYNKDLD